MSYYFCIVGTRDQPLFELEFGTSKQGGDGIARFSQEARHMNPFIVHSSLDFVDEMQWTNNQMYVLDIWNMVVWKVYYQILGTSSVLTNLPPPISRPFSPRPLRGSCSSTSHTRQTPLLNLRLHLTRSHLSYHIPLRLLRLLQVAGLRPLLALRYPTTLLALKRRKLSGHSLGRSSRCG